MWQGLIAMVIAGLLGLIAIAFDVEGDQPIAVVIPPMPNYAPTVIDVPACTKDCICDGCCYDQAIYDYEDEFTALFNSYEVKRAKNGALMIRRGNTGSYKFAKKG